METLCIQLNADLHCFRFKHCKDVDYEGENVTPNSLPQINTQQVEHLPIYLDNT